MKNVESSFDYLYECGMLTQNDDAGNLTPMGRFAGAMPVDLQLSRLIGYGIALGLGIEAAVLVSALSQAKTMFRIASHFIHKDPDEFHSIAKHTFLGAVKLDSNIYSEPIMYLNAYIQYSQLPIHQRDKWVYSHGLVLSRFKSFISQTNSIIDKVVKFERSKSKDEKLVGDKNKCEPLDDWKINTLRLLLVWTCDSNFIRMTPIFMPVPKKIGISSSEAKEAHFKQLLPPDSKFTFEDNYHVMYDAKFSEERSRQSSLDHLTVIITELNAKPVPLLYVVDDIQCVLNIALLLSDENTVKKHFNHLSDILMKELNVIGDIRLEPDITYKIIQVINPSSHGVLNLKLLTGQLSSFLSLNIPTIGNPKIITSNFSLSEGN